LKREWDTAVCALHDPDVELDVESFATVLSLHHRVRRAGVIVDDHYALTVLLDKLGQQFVDEDSDADLADASLLA
jgi:hypothetical protein